MIHELENYQTTSDSASLVRITRTFQKGGGIGGFLCLDMKTAKPTYYEKLRDPRWQKRRLEIMERDKFTCQSCRSKTNTLNVHHSFYEKGKDPWDYPDEVLSTQCEDCHKAIEDAMKAVAFSVSTRRYRAEALAQIAHALDPQSHETAGRLCWIVEEIPRLLFAYYQATNGDTVDETECGEVDFESSMGVLMDALYASKFKIREIRRAQLSRKNTAGDPLSSLDEMIDAAPESPGHEK